jgi:hypothetical protein
MTRRIDEIVVGERHRRGAGPPTWPRLGLLHPIVNRPDGTLIAGERRPLAAKQDAGQRHGSLRRREGRASR